MAWRRVLRIRQFSDLSVGLNRGDHVLFTEHISVFFGQLHLSLFCSCQIFSAGSFCTCFGDLYYRRLVLDCFVGW